MVEKGEGTFDPISEYRALARQGSLSEGTNSTHRAADAAEDESILEASRLAADFVQRDYLSSARRATGTWNGKRDGDRKLAQLSLAHAVRLWH